MDHSLFRRSLLMGVFLLTLSSELHADVTLSSNTKITGTNYAIGNSATGTGSMLVDGGSVLSIGMLSIASTNNAIGTVTVTGANSQLNLTGSLFTGKGAAGTGTTTTGTLNIWSGGQVTTTGSNAYVGYAKGTTGTVNVDGTSDGTLTGAASTLTFNTTAVVGYSGSGTLNITNGGHVIGTAGVVLGNNSGSTGTIIVSGTNSTFSDQGGLTIGDFYQGIVSVTNSGTFNSVATADQWTFIGFSGGSAMVTVAGAGSSFNTSGGYGLGTSGNGVLNITDGATSLNTFNTAYTSGSYFGTGFIGDQAGVTGTLNVNGAGSKWSSVGYLTIGNGGAGVINITSGGIVSSTLNSVSHITDYEAMFLSTTNGSSATILVDGAGSQWNVTGNGQITTGNIGSPNTPAVGTTIITVRNGGAANLTDLTLYGNATVTVTGTNSVMTTKIFDLSVVDGNSASPTVTISNGGTLNSLNSSVAFSSSTNSRTGGAVSVDGSTSQWNVTGTLSVGAGGDAGLITLTNGGKLSVYTDATHQATGIGDGAIVLGTAPYSGTLASVAVLYIGTGAGAGIVNAASVGGNFDGTPAHTADSTIIFNHNQNNYYFTNTGTSSGTGVAITGSTKINVVAGTTILTANSTNNGATSVTGGKLIVNNTGGAGTSGTGSGNITIGTNGTLGGTGRITLSGTNSTIISGTLAPGSVNSSGASTVGTLTIDSGSSTAAHILTLAGGASLQFDLASGLSSDRISLLNGSVADLLFNSNVINFTDLTAGVLDAGDYILFTTADLNNYSGLTIGNNNAITSGLTIGSGLENYSNACLAVSGNNIVLELAAVPEPATPVLILCGFLALLWRLRKKPQF